MSTPTSAPEPGPAPARAVLELLGLLLLVVAAVGLNAAAWMAHPVAGVAVSSLTAGAVGALLAFDRSEG